jgi:hypothetical protein
VFPFLFWVDRVLCPISAYTADDPCPFHLSPRLPDRFTLESIAQTRRYRRLLHPIHGHIRSATRFDFPAHPHPRLYTQRKYQQSIICVFSRIKSTPVQSRSFRLPTATNSPQTTVVDESDRGRIRKSRPISTGSSFAALTPSSDYHHPHPHPQPLHSKPSHVNPMASVRRGGTSFIALDGGFIGQSPVAPPRDRERREKGKGTPRTILGSFMTFGSTKKPSLPVVISDPESGPRSAQAVMFPL